MELGQDRKAKALACKADDEKGIPDLLGSNITYVLCLWQVVAHKDLPPIWKDLVESPKCQHLVTLQMALDDTACCLSICASIVATLGLLELTLALGF